MSTRTTAFLFLAGLALVSTRSFGQAEPATTEHKMVKPSELQWGDAPPVMPPGAKLAVLNGDPSKPGLFIVRLKFPANYKIPAHWHPTDENITVISGAFWAGMGDKLDPAKTTELPPG